MPKNNIIEELKQQVERYDVVSFDVFDTLLIRPYAKPVDLFNHLGELENQPLFKEKRITAEQKARKELHPQEDITIDDIYRHLDTEFINFKTKEVALELNVLKQNPEIFEIYHYALKLNKKILIISDMYLHRETLLKTLEKNGYNHFEEFYVSSESKLTKSSGNLYRHVLKEQQLDPSKVLHIGDNYHADVQMAKKQKINAYYYPKVIDRFEELCKKNNEIKTLEFIENYKSSGSSALIMQMAIDFIISDLSWRNSYWYLIGKYYGGILAYSYCSFIKKNLENEKIREVAFIARDGYVLKKVFDLIKKESTKTHYVYSPRIFTEISSLVDHSLGNDKSVNNRVKKLLNAEGISQEELKKLSQKEFDKISNYLKSFNFESRFAIVDSLTSAFSSQKLIKSILQEKKIFGFYWHVLRMSNSLLQNNKHKAYIEEKSENIIYWDLFEFLITSPELPIKSITAEGKPVYFEKNQYEINRMAIYEKVCPGIIDLTKSFKKSFKVHRPVYFSKEDTTSFIDLLCYAPNDIDKEMFKGVYVSRNSDNSIYNPLMITSKNEILKNDAYGKVVPPWNRNYKFRSLLGRKKHKLEINIPFIFRYVMINSKSHYKQKLKILGICLYKKDIFPDRKRIKILNITIVNLR